MTNSLQDLDDAKHSPVAMPVSFDGNFAFHHAASGETGFVLCGTWGYDELCSRKFLRVIADRLSSLGYPVLRFDYPGTANMLDPVPESGLRGWVSHAGLAADRLKQLSGCRKIVYLGFGIGTAIAFLAAKARNDVAGLILAAPVTSGRRYVRELQLQAQVANEKLGVALKDRHCDTGLAGFTMSDSLQADLKTIKLSAGDLASSPKCLVLTRDGNGGEVAFADDLKKVGCTVESHPFEGYLQLLLTPTTSMMPAKALEQIVDWSCKTFPHGASPRPAPANATTEKLQVVGKTFVEQPVRFGQNGQFFGIHCLPKGNRRGATLVFLNAGYIHHCGWGRIWVRAARELAEKGIATFRFDMANVGETPPTPDCPDQVIYTDDQFDDIGVAAAYLKSGGHGPVVLVGRCSGAYAALHTCARRDEIDGALLINQLKMIWHPEDDIYEVLTTGARPLNEYRQRAFRIETFKRLLTGDIDLRRAIPNILSHAQDRLVQKMTPYLGSLTQLGRDRKACFEVLDTLKRKNMPIRMLTCDQDGSQDELTRYFGTGHAGLAAYPNIRVSAIPDTDHNLTSTASQDHLLDVLLEVGAGFGSGDQTRKSAA